MAVVLQKCRAGLVGGTEPGSVRRHAHDPPRPSCAGKLGVVCRIAGGGTSITPLTTVFCGHQRRRLRLGEIQQALHLSRRKDPARRSSLTSTSLPRRSSPRWHSDIGARVLAVGEVEQRHAVDHPDADGRDRVAQGEGGESLASTRSRQARYRATKAPEMIALRVRRRPEARRNRASRCAHRALMIDHGAERPPDQALISCGRPGRLPLSHIGAPCAPGGRGASRTRRSPSPCRGRASTRGRSRRPRRCR